MSTTNTQETKPSQQFVMEEGLLNEILAYLGNRPAKEVYPLLQKFSAVRALNAQTTPDVPVKEENTESEVVSVSEESAEPTAA